MEEKLFQKLNELEDKIECLSLSTKEILNLEEAVIYLRISRSYLYKLTSRKEIAHYKPSGKLIYFKKVDLDDWILRNREMSIIDAGEEIFANLKRN